MRSLPRLVHGATYGTTVAKIVKISVSLDRELVAWLRSRAATLGTSLSAVLAAAAGQERQAEARQAVSDMLGLPKLTEEELEAARAELYGAPAKAVRKPPSKARGTAKATTPRRRKQA